MVRTAVLKVDDHAVEGVSTNKAKGEKMVLEPPMNSAQRRTLGDITNFPSRNIAVNHGANQKQQSMPLSSKEYAEKLQKENMRLMKALKERNAIIERSEIELQKFRINLQMIQAQNFQLAQTNTRILAEIRTSKDQLKALQHELSFKNGVLMARKLPLEPQKLPCTHHDASEDEVLMTISLCEPLKLYISTIVLHCSNVFLYCCNYHDLANASGGACETFHPKGKDHKTASESSDGNSLQINEKANNKRVSGSSRPANSEVLDIIVRPGESAQTTNIRRVSLRRQSGRFNIQELGVSENLNGIHDDQEFAAKAGCSASDLSIVSKPEAVELHETKETTGKNRRVSSRRQSTEAKSQRAIKVSTDPDIVEESSQVSSSVSTELKTEPKNNTRHDEEAVEMRETYVGRRPSRQAAVKIKSYKEVSLKEKMRRDF